MTIVAMAYEYGIKGAAQDRGEATRWYVRLAELGDPPAMLELGLIAVRNEQYEVASAWLLHAARLGAPNALSMRRAARDRASD
jgi:TPR repeat protein